MISVASMPTAEVVTEMMELVRLTANASEIFHAMDRFAADLVKQRLFTVLRFLPESGEVERIYSGDPVHFPVGGRDTKRGTVWAGHVIERGETFLARDESDIRAHLSNPDFIIGYGIRSVLNAPIGVRGCCLGTLNLSWNFYSGAEEIIPVARLLAGLLAPVLLDLKVQSAQGKHNRGC